MGDTGKSKLITFSGESAQMIESTGTSWVFAGYATTDYTVGRTWHEYEGGSYLGVYKINNCDDLKKIKKTKEEFYPYSDASNCKFIKTNNGGIGVVFFIMVIGLKLKLICQNEHLIQLMLSILQVEMIIHYLVLVDMQQMKQI